MSFFNKLWKNLRETSKSSNPTTPNNNSGSNCHHAVSNTSGKSNSRQTVDDNHINSCQTNSHRKQRNHTINLRVKSTSKITTNGECNVENIPPTTTRRSDFESDFIISDGEEFNLPPGIVSEMAKHNQTVSRHLSVSRSGRYKHKSRKRSNLFDVVRREDEDVVDGGDVISSCDRLQDSSKGSSRSRKDVLNDDKGNHSLTPVTTTLTTSRTSPGVTTIPTTEGNISNSRTSSSYYRNQPSNHSNHTPSHSNYRHHSPPTRPNLESLPRQREQKHHDQKPHYSFDREEQQQPSSVPSTRYRETMTMLMMKSSTVDKLLPPVVSYPPTYVSSSSTRNHHRPSSHHHNHHSHHHHHNLHHHPSPIEVNVMTINGRVKR